jgi:nitrite reductase/ring-hydroxylating ferredoxin subunit
MVTFFLILGGVLWGLSIGARLFFDEHVLCTKHEWKYDTEKKEIVCKTCKKVAG